MSAFSLDDLNAELPLKAHLVPMPEFGAGKEAYVAELSMDEREQRIETWRAEYKKGTGKADDLGANAWIVAACLCDSERAFLCGDAMELARTAAAIGKRGNAVVRLYLKAIEVNSIGQAEIQELEKN